MVFASCDSNDSDDQADPQLSLVTSSNTSGMVTYTDLLAANPTVQSYTVSSIDVDGISYNADTDAITFASRTSNQLQTYTGIKSAFDAGTASISLSVSGATTEFDNPRETAVSDDYIVVTQDQAVTNGNSNKLFLYQKGSSGFTLIKTFTVDFKLWGIHMDGDDLYAVVDLTGDLVQFKDFASNASGTISATKRVTIEGLTRTHGITYSSSDDVMILTDVASATSDTDGGLVIIKNFSTVFNASANLGTIATTNQLRIYGANSLLGNPVDVAYDNVTRNIYVAERLNAGGQVLTFSYPTATGDATPTSVRAEAGVSSIFVLRN
jgi:hypothetical protein